MKDTEQQTLKAIRERTSITYWTTAQLQDCALPLIFFFLILTSHSKIDNDINSDINIDIDISAVADHI